MRSTHRAPSSRSGAPGRPAPHDRVCAHLDRQLTVGVRGPSIQRARGSHGADLDREVRGVPHHHHLVDRPCPLPGARTRCHALPSSRMRVSAGSGASTNSLGSRASRARRGAGLAGGSGSRGPSPSPGPSPPSPPRKRRGRPSPTALFPPLLRRRLVRPRNPLHPSPAQPAETSPFHHPRSRAGRCTLSQTGRHQRLADAGDAVDDRVHDRLHHNPLHDLADALHDLPRRVREICASALTLTLAASRSLALHCKY